MFFENGVILEKIFQCCQLFILLWLEFNQLFQEFGNGLQIIDCIRKNARNVIFIFLELTLSCDLEELRLDDVFLDHFSFQCSYCAPGFVNGAVVLLERLERAPVPRDRVEETVLAAMDPHICRCTGYVRYLSAIREVVLATPGLTTPADGKQST